MLILIKMAEAGHGESQQIGRPHFPHYANVYQLARRRDYFHNLVGALLSR